MACRHGAVVGAQRRACGELEALGVTWFADVRCPACGRLVEISWHAGRCTVWERRGGGMAFLRVEAAPPAEPPPADF